MSESKTYIFGENQNGGSNGMLGLLAPLLQKQGVDPNVLLAMKGNNGMCGEGKKASSGFGMQRHSYRRCL